MFHELVGWDVALHFIIDIIAELFKCLIKKETKPLTVAMKLSIFTIFGKFSTRPIIVTINPIIARTKLII
jgi:hypothetical protein